MLVCLVYFYYYVGVISLLIIAPLQLSGLLLFIFCYFIFTYFLVVFLFSSILLKIFRFFVVFFPLFLKSCFSYCNLEWKVIIYEAERSDFFDEFLGIQQIVAEYVRLQATRPWEELLLSFLPGFSVIFFGWSYNIAGNSVLPGEVIRGSKILLDKPNLIRPSVLNLSPYEFYKKLGFEAVLKNQPQEILEGFVEQTDNDVKKKFLARKFFSNLELLRSNPSIFENFNRFSFNSYEPQPAASGYIFTQIINQNSSQSLISVMRSSKLGVALELTEEKAEKLVATVVEDYAIEFLRSEYLSLTRQQQIDLIFKDGENLQHILSKPESSTLTSWQNARAISSYLDICKFRNLMLEDGQYDGKISYEKGGIYQSLVLEVKNVCLGDRSVEKIVGYNLLGLKKPFLQSVALSKTALIIAVLDKPISFEEYDFAAAAKSIEKFRNVEKAKVKLDVADDIVLVPPRSGSVIAVLNAI
jgi:hypothetical protein